jgi:flagellar motor switch protein FliG
VLKYFDDVTIEFLCREMSAFSMIPEGVQKQAMDEFGSIVVQSVSAALGGLAYAQHTLGLAKGDHKASAIIGRVGPASSSGDVIKDISDMEGQQIYSLLKSEQPQTISFMLSHLDPTKASQVLALLSPELREDVVERLGIIEATSQDLAAKIVRSLSRHFEGKAQSAFHSSGGVQAVADLLNRLDKNMTKSLLARLEERNAQLGAAIRKKMFSFEDLSRLQPADLQRVLREVDSANLSMAMKSASESLCGKIYASISKRAAESLREEIELLGRVRLKDVEIAQEAIITVVRRLEDENAITLDGDGAQSLVA